MKKKTAARGWRLAGEPLEDVVPSMAQEAGALLEAPLDLEPDDFQISYHAGEGFGVPNPQDLPLIEEMARLEGILLDPLYTGKAWAGMLEQLRRGLFNGNGPIVFLHSGGTAALFA